MQRIFQILFSLVVISGLAFAQGTSRDLSQTPSNFNNPEYVHGPNLENPLLSFSESFEGTTFPPAGWLKANPDGGTGWDRQLDGTTPIPGWTGGTITVPPGGGSAVAFCTWTTGGASANDQWLITPQITNVQPGDMLTFWMRVFANDSYAENFDIRISTTGTNTANFTTIVQAFTWPIGGIADEWISYTYELTNHVAAGSNIYIAFREHVTDNLNDGAAVMLDLVEVTLGGGGTVYFEDFEGFTAGGQVACQDPVNWTTWSNAPCGNRRCNFINQLCI
ncbi:MAG: choice-of-anchor J domain-containing protein [bacterium]|nr:choice-of-anchor J domain-containing protein [bacterium]